MSDRELMELALRVAAEAADLLVSAGSRVRTGVATKSSATDMVTDVDRASEELVVDRLLDARPGDGIVAEEGSSRQSESGIRWVIDPLDGTTNFLYGFGSWAVSIAAERERPDGDGYGAVAGVVVDVARGETFSSTAGEGAWRDGRPIRASGAVSLAEALVATGFGYRPERRLQQAKVLVDVLPVVRDIRREGAAAVDLCSVACGRVDGYYERGLQAWDQAAGALIAREAGALVEPLPDDGTDDVGVVAAAPGIVNALRDVLRSSGA